MYYHHRHFGGHKHDTNKYTNAADTGPTMNMRKPSPTVIDSGKHMLPTKPADVASVRTSHTMGMMEPTSIKMTESMPTMRIISKGDDKPLPTGIAKSLPSLVSKVDGSKDSIHHDKPGAMALITKPGSSQSYGQKIKDMIQEPIFWPVLIGVLVLLVTVILALVAIKKRRRRKFYDQKAKTIMERNKGLC